MHHNVTSILNSFEHLSTFQRRAALVVISFALLSALAFAYIALRILRDAAVLLFTRGDRTSRPANILFFRTQIGHYIGCLIISNVLISIAGLINFRWWLDSGLSRGTTCLAQALLMQIGLWGTCWFTAAHGVHTLISLVFRVGQARWHSVIIVFAGWTIAFAAAFLPMRKRHIYGPAGISCSITHAYHKETFFFGALPILVGAFVSITVYSIRLIVLREKHSVDKAQTTLRGGKTPEDYNKFVNVIIWTMFWFPLAFVLLLCPLSIVYVFQSTGRSVPFVLYIFAASCANMLGFVNVGLLCNIFRVISPMSNAARASAEATFGHDASAESPMDPQPNFHSKPAYENSFGTYNSSSMSLNHSRTNSWSSTDSETGLVRGEKVLHKPQKTKAVPPGLHIIPPAELGRQLDRQPNVTWLPKGKSREGGAIESPLHTVFLSPPPRSNSLSGGHDESQREDEGYSSDRFDIGDELPSKPKPTLVSDFSGTSRQILPLRINGKSAAPSTARGRQPLSLTIPTQPVPASLPSPDDSKYYSRASYASTMLSTEIGSDYSGETMEAYRVYPHAQDDEEREAVGGFPPGLAYHSAWHRRMTRASVWSQESGYNMSQSPIEEPVSYWHVIEDLFEPGVSPSEPANAVGTKGNRVTFARPITLRIQPFTAESKRSDYFSNPKSRPFTATRNDSSV